MSRRARPQHRDRANPHANRGVPRNKKPLQNICYRFEEKRGEGVRYFMLWGYERDINRAASWYFHGEVTENEIRAHLTPNQWAKFQRGDRQFVKQRRVDGRNVPKESP